MILQAFSLVLSSVKLGVGIKFFVNLLGPLVSPQPEFFMPDYKGKIEEAGQGSRAFGEEILCAVADRDLHRKILDELSEDSDRYLGFLNRHDIPREAVDASATRGEVASTILASVRTERPILQDLIFSWTNSLNYAWPGTPVNGVRDPRLILLGFHTAGVVNCLDDNMFPDASETVSWITQDNEIMPEGLMHRWSKIRDLAATRTVMAEAAGILEGIFGSLRMVYAGNRGDISDIIELGEKS
ncbi:MAG: hypothetical protein LBT40_17575, partial [Deltaproteobacteria bacterium]|nr:hypothetical protein [Deltaproteobacteria bacterium]